MVGKIIYEDDRFVLADESDNFGVRVVLLMKSEHRVASVYSYTAEDAVVVNAELSGRNPWERVHVKRYMRWEEYVKLQRRVLGVKTPKEFIILFLGLVSPSLASLCKEVSG